MQQCNSGVQWPTLDYTDNVNEFSGGGEFQTSGDFVASTQEDKHTEVSGVGNSTKNYMQVKTLGQVGHSARRCWET